MKTIDCSPRKLLLIQFLILLLVLKANGQQNAHGNVVDAEPPKFDGRGVIQPDLVNISKVNWKNVAYSTDAPFFIASWVNGMVFFDNGFYFRDSLLRFDWIKNEIYFSNNGKPNFFVQPVTEFSLYDNKDGTTNTYHFRNGYPAIGQLSGKSFFQVISSGDNFQLLKYWSVFEGENFRYNSAYEQVYKKKTDWYLYDVKNNKIRYITLKTKSLAHALPGYTAELKEFIGDKNKFLQEDVAVALVDRINGK
ncbi:MAG: hypothetical protein V4722_03830 [Bacteroidota bacterium]